MKTANVGDLISEGSAKNKHYVDGTDIDFRFLNTYSVFDRGRAPDEIPGKAKSVCACAVESFRIAKELGVPTHFVEQIDDVTIRVHEAQIITERPITDDDENFVVPGEFIDRKDVAGSVHLGFVDGTQKPMDYGFPTNAVPAVGTPFPEVVHMLTTKFEPVDRKISDDALCKMAAMTIEEVMECWKIIDIITPAIGEKMRKGGFKRFDGKCEFLMGIGRQILLGDVLGTPDEDRPVLEAGLKKGEVVHYSKEYPREIHKASGYYKVLKEARKKGLEGDDLPSIPNLSEEQIGEMARRYAAVTKAYAGVNVTY